MSICESKISTDQLVLKEPCKVEFPLRFYRQVLVTLARFPIAVTSWYKVSIEPIGFAIGRHLYSLALTPGEEVEIEVFRSAKVERELSQQCSTEVEFMSEFSETLRSEWSRKTTSNTKQSGGVSGKISLFGIIEIGGHYEPEYSETEEDFTKAFAEATLHAKYRVDRKFDIHIGLKTTVENRCRSTRKIRNPNACQSVTYNYFQLMRKFKITVTRISLGFDYVPVAPRILTTQIPAVIRSYEMPPLELKALVSGRDEMPQSSDTSSSLPTATGAASKPAALSLAYVATSEEQTSTPAIRTLLHPIIEEPSVLELTQERLLTKMDRQKVFKNPAEKKQLDGLLNSLVRKFPLKIVVKESEVCVNTNSMYVEPMVGLCLACDKHMVEMRKIELEKAKVELEKAKQEIKG